MILPSRSCGQRGASFQLAKRRRSSAGWKPTPRETKVYDCSCTLKFVAVSAFARLSQPVGVGDVVPVVCGNKFSETRRDGAHDGQAIFHRSCRAQISFAVRPRLGRVSISLQKNARRIVSQRSYNGKIREPNDGGCLTNHVHHLERLQRRRPASIFALVRLRASPSLRG